MGNLGKRLRTREPVPAVPPNSSGPIDWRSVTPQERRARVEAWSRTRPLFAADWINAAVLLDELFHDDAQSLDADAKLQHYARQHPEVILTEAQARAQTPNYDSGRGSSVVSCPWTFAGEPVPESWGR